MAAAAKFTPGPWSVETPMGRSAPWIVPAGLQAYEWEPIATLGDCDEDLPPRSAAQQRIDADARLIAAAPELLVALSALMEIERADVGMEDFDDADSVGAYQDDGGNIKDMPLTFGHLRRARAAVAKAYGA